MKPFSLVRILWLLVMAFYSSFLQAGSGKDSLSVLQPLSAPLVHSIYAPLIDGSHPSQYQFAISNPSEEQFQAWLKGDFIPLQGLFTTDDMGGGIAAMFSNTREAISEARAAIAKVQEIGSFISQFDGQSLVELPVGMQKMKEDGTGFIIAINSITLYPTHAELTVYAEAKTADMEEPIILGAPDIKFTRRGGITLGSLGLLGKKTIPVFSNKAYLEFQGARIVDNNFVEDEGTYVSFNCDGLQKFNIDLEILFDRSVIMPADTSREDSVRAELEVFSKEGLNDILLDATIHEPFVHPSKPDVIWTVEDVVFDFSETLHSSSVEFPVAEYTPDIVLQDPQMQAMWKGIYIGELSVELPEDFIGTDSSAININDITIQDVVIDDTGFTGIVKLEPVLDLNQGDMDGWGFSIDSLMFHVYQNQLAEFAFDGLVNIPLFNESDDGSAEEVNSIRYAADFDIMDDTYHFRISEVEERELHSKMLKATVTLSPASHLDIIYSKTDGFDVSATLTGVLDVDAPLSENEDSRIGIPSIEFNNLVLANQQPFVQNVGTWNIDSLEISLKAFTLTVKDVAMVSYPDQPDRVDVQFISRVSLGSENTALMAEGGFRIKGKIEVLENNKQNWKYDGFKMDMLHVELETESFAFTGEIIFFDDLVDPINNVNWGTGFQGKAHLQLKKLGELEVEAMALFGSVDSTEYNAAYRYFFVDVMTRIPEGMLTVGMVDIRGLGGGLYVNMRQEGIEQDFAGAAEDEQLPTYVNNGDEAQLTAYEQAIIAKLGQSLSGIRYVPDPSVKLGINVAVVLTTAGQEETFNANVVLNVQFNHNGGFDHIRLAGYANIMAPISWSGPACTGVSIKFQMEYVSGDESDSGGGEFSATAFVFVNIEDIIKGSKELTPGANEENGGLPEFYAGSDCTSLHYAGGVDIFLSNDDWWINIGVPNRENDPSVPFPYYPIGLEVTQLGLEITTYLDIGTNIPPFPGLPANVAELTGLGNLLADEQARATGNGFAFGARLLVDSDINVFGIVSGDMHLDVGFDIMLQRYNDAICVNNGNKPLGINGWYAAGQAWAYVEGEVKVLGFSVLQAALAAAIQIKGPSPFYGRGAIAGRYRVLGGLAKGDFRLPLEFGKQCLLEGGEEPALEYNLIGGILPIDGANTTPVNTDIVIDFNYPVGEVVELNNNDGEPTNYIIVLDQFEVQVDGQSVEGDLIMSEDGYYAEFLLEEMLEGETAHVILATATLYECDENGNPISGAIDTDVETINFITATALDYIPTDNIVNAWPANGQFNYYQGESVPNMLTFKSGQDDLMIIPEDAWPLIRLSNSEETHETSFSYDANANQINYDLPALTLGGAYKAELGFEDDRGFTVLLEYYFRVSSYNTFSEKITSINLGNMTVASKGYKAEIEGLLEPFGREELVGLEWMQQGGLKLEADLLNTEWMGRFYAMDGDADYNLYNESDLEECGDPTILNYSLAEGLPRRAISFLPIEGVGFTQVSDYKVTADNYTAIHIVSTQLGWNVNDVYVNYYIPYIVKRDYDFLKAASYIIPSPQGMSDVHNVLQNQIPGGDSAPVTSNDFCLNKFNEEIVDYETDTVRYVSRLQDEDFEPSSGMNYPVKFMYSFPNTTEEIVSRNLQY